MSAPQLTIEQMLEADLANKNKGYYNELISPSDKFVYHFIDQHQQSYQGRSFFAKIFKIFNRTNLSKYGPLYGNLITSAIKVHAQEKSSISIFGFELPWFKNRTRNILESWGLFKDGHLIQEIDYDLVVKNLEQQAAPKSASIEKSEQQRKTRVAEAAVDEDDVWTASVSDDDEHMLSVDDFITHHQVSLKSGCFSFLNQTKINYDELRADKGSAWKKIYAHANERTFWGKSNRTRLLLEQHKMAKIKDGVLYHPYDMPPPSMLNN